MKSGHPIVRGGYSGPSSSGEAAKLNLGAPSNPVPLAFRSIHASVPELPLQSSHPGVVIWQSIGMDFVRCSERVWGNGGDPRVRAGIKLINRHILVHCITAVDAACSVETSTNTYLTFSAMLAAVEAN